MEYGRTLLIGGLCGAILLSAMGWSVTVSAAGLSTNRSTEPATLAPDFTLPAISDRDRSITLSAYRGKTVYLDFWSSWCAPCRESLPLLSELHQEFSGDDFQIVGVNLDALPADGRRIVEQYAIEYPVASDITGIAAKRFGASTLPAAFLIDGDGVIQPELPQMDKQNISAIKASLLELIEQERQTRPPVN